MSIANSHGEVIVIAGGQWGDEGKGKIVSYLAKNKDIAAFARAGTGPNAGHTVMVDDKIWKLRLIPSGFFAEKSRLFIGAGMLVNPEILLKEIADTGIQDRIMVDYQTGIIELAHINRDKSSKYLRDTVGSTGSGCGPANEDRAKRVLKLAKDIESLQPFTGDVSDELNDIIDAGGTVVVEGSQATFLSLTHGTYPYVTSKDVTASTFLADVGIGPTRATEVIVVLKSYVTRVGTGPLKGELSEEEVRRRGWEEYGTVTNRLRRVAPFDFTLARKAVRINGATAIALTKLDILYPSIANTTEYAQLPTEALEFITKLEDTCGVPVKYISTGPNASALIKKD